MLRISDRRLVWFPLLVSFAAATPATDVPKGWHEFVSGKGGYVAYYPGSWHVLEPSLPTLYISSFRPSEAVTAVIVPDHGATIGVAPPPAGVTSIAQWITRDRAVTPVLSEKSFTLPRPGPNPPLRVTEVAFEPVEGPGTVSWYFDLSGHLLVANLSYWNGDPNAARFRQVLRDIVRTIAPMPR